MTTETAPYEPQVKAYEPSQYMQATELVRMAYNGAKAYENAPETQEALAALLGAMEAEPEDTLLASDYRYLMDRTEKVSDTVRQHFHPINAATLKELADAREHLKSAYATWKIS